MSKRPEPRKWVPQHPEKYIGDVTNIIARSSWEIRFLNWCDANSNVLSYSSEETIIPYRCGTDGKVHKYYMDFRIQIKNKLGIVKTYLIEIKPRCQRLPPKYPGKQTKRYLEESMTYIKNQSKWEAATVYAKDRGWEFLIFDEYDLGISNK
jgi:hypothetical protein